MKSMVVGRAENGGCEGNYWLSAGYSTIPETPSVGFATYARKGVRGRNPPTLKPASRSLLIVGVHPFDAGVNLGVARNHTPTGAPLIVCNYWAAAEAPCSRHLAHGGAPARLL